MLHHLWKWQWFHGLEFGPIACLPPTSQSFQAWLATAASMLRCTSRHCRRRSTPYFLIFHLPLPRNLMPVESTNKCCLLRLGWCAPKHPNLFVCDTPCCCQALAYTDPPDATVHQAQSLAQKQIEQAVDSQAKLNGCIREGLEMA